MSNPTPEQIYQAREVCINKQRDKILELEAMMSNINDLNHQGRYEEAKVMLARYMSAIK